MSSTTTNRANEEYENDTLEDVDQLLDDALEESYRSVLEEKAAAAAQANNAPTSGDDYFNERQNNSLVRKKSWTKLW